MHLHLNLAGHSYVPVLIEEVWKRACREKTLPSSEGRTLSGRSVVTKADWNKQRERSLVERGERTTPVSACKQRQRSSVERGERTTPVSACKQRQRSSVERGERTTPSVGMQAETAIFGGARGKNYPSVGMQQRQRSSVERGERTTPVSACKQRQRSSVEQAISASASGAKTIAAGRGKLLASSLARAKNQAG